MFYGCSQLTDLAGLKNLDVGNVTSMEAMFRKCSKLTDTSAINDWDIANVESFRYMFLDCPSHPEFTKRAGTWRSGTFTPTT